MSKTINTGVKLDEALHTRLKALGTLKERTPHWLMRVRREQPDRPTVSEASLLGGWLSRR